MEKVRGLCSVKQTVKATISGNLIRLLSYPVTTKSTKLQEQQIKSPSI